MIKRLALLALVLVVALAAASPQGHKPKKSKEALQSNLKNIKNQKHEVTKKLRETKRQVRRVKGDLDELDHQMNQLEHDLDKTKDELSTGRKSQVIVNEQLQVAEKMLSNKREEVRHRLKLMYMRGNADIVAALASSNNVGQFASRKYVFERVAKKDRELFDEVQALRKRVADRKRSADRLVVKISDLKKRQESQQEDLEDTRSTKHEKLVSLKGKQQELQKVANELDEAEADVESEIAAYNRTNKHKLPAFTGRFMRPVNGPITSGFGMRYHPILHRNRLHKGIDISAHNGTPIHAAADGIVIIAGWGRGYGNRVILDHGGGVSTLYGHASRLYVSTGQRVKRGQVIAAVGSTGLSTGNHLHWEVHIGGRAVNPVGR